MLKPSDLVGLYKTPLAAEPVGDSRKALWHTLHIGKHGDHSAWFDVQRGTELVQQSQSLATAIRRYNEIQEVEE